jgi:DNA-binding transcriptional LysR family regulator
MVMAGVGLGIMRREDVEQAELTGLAFALPLKLPPVSLRFAYLKKRANDPILRAVLTALSTVWALDPVEERQAG